VWAKPTNTFLLRNLTIAEQLAVWRLEQIGESLCESNKRKYTLFHNQRNALIMFLAFLIIMAVACFNKLSFSTQTARLFAPDKLLYRRILGRCPNPQAFKKA